MLLMRKLLPILIASLFLLQVFVLAAPVVPSNGHADVNVPDKALVAPVFDPETSPVARVVVEENQLQVLELSGCKVVHKVKSLNALDCPVSLVSQLGLKEDLKVSALDLNADKQIGADKVWALGYTGAGSLVAVLDTGVNYSHVELAGSIVNGRDFVNDDNDSMDDNGHGSYVAGIITANGVNSNAKGVAPDADVLAVKVLSSTGGGYLSDTVAAIYYVVDGPDGVYGTGDEFNADVISMSLGTSPPYTYKGSNCDYAYPAMTSAISYARSKGVSVAAASGNSGSSGVSLPGCVSGVITVGAVDSLDKVASWSGKGRSLDLVAPGVNIFSCSLSGGYGSGSGTSAATPMVSGTVALMKQKNPALTVNQVYNNLISTAKDLGKAGFDTSAGYGRVNALAAVNIS